MISLFIFTSNSRGTLYGVGTYLKHLTESLLRIQEISVYLISYHSNKNKEFLCIKQNSRLTEAFIPSPLVESRNENAENMYAIRIVDLVAEMIMKAQNVIFQINYPNTLPLVKQLKSRFNFPLISVIHSAMWQVGFNGNKHKFNAVWTKYKNLNDKNIQPIKDEKEIYELSDKIISVTKYMREYILEYYDIPKERVVVIYNGINVNSFCTNRLQNKIILKKKFGFKPREKIIIFSGRLDVTKGLLFLLDAFNIVVNEIKDVRLVVIGEDSGDISISKCLTHCDNNWSKVTFTGFISQERLFEFYQIADVGILPSIYDHCPYTLLEMVASQIPLILTRIDGLNEMLNDGQCLFVDLPFNERGEAVFNKNAMAEAIVLLLKDAGKSKKISRYHQELIRTKFSGDRMAEEMITVLRSLCKDAYNI